MCKVGFFTTTTATSTPTNPYAQLINIFHKNRFNSKFEFKTAILLALYLVLGPFNLYGQKNDVQNWNSAVVDLNFAPFLFELEVDYNRLVSGGPEWREYAIQPSIEFYPNNSFDFYAGVYFSETVQDDINDTKELRPLIGIRWNIIKPEKRIYVKLNVKLEHRFFNSKSGNNNNNSTRLRTRLDFILPITKKSYNEDKDLYAILRSEVFENFKTDIQERFQSTFKQHLGLGYRFNYTWRFDAVYIYQESYNSIEADAPDNTSNVLSFTLKHFIRTKPK